MEQLLASYIDNQLANSSVQVQFPKPLRNIKAEDLRVDCAEDRLDLRDEACLTIDCAHTQDMDDAVSVAQTEGGYLLGVHIADVASYVTPGSALDTAAMQRGTSYYLPDRTIPMLPAVLSNDLCSLNPQQARNTISVLIDLDNDGRVIDYTIEKTLICSRVKGTYDEVNDILSFRATGEVQAKYSGVTKMLYVMAELSQKLHALRVADGARDEGDVSRRVSVVDGDIVVSVCHKGLSERIVEEFMILANRLVAQYFLENGLPGIYRAQTSLDTLAEYLSGPCVHASLALSEYLHFTSPIRRLADLKVHQVLTAHLKGCPVQAIHYLFDDVIDEACNVAQRRSRTADSIQLACEKRAISYYYQLNASATYSGQVCGRNRNGNIVILVDETASRVELASRIRVKPGQRLTFGIECSLDLRHAYAVHASHLPMAA